MITDQMIKAALSAFVSNAQHGRYAAIEQALIAALGHAGWQDISTAPASGVDDDEQTPVLLWVEGGGWKGEGCVVPGYVLRRRNGDLVGKPNGYSGFTVKLWQPQPTPPVTRHGRDTTTEGAL